LLQYGWARLKRFDADQQRFELFSKVWLSLSRQTVAAGLTDAQASRRLVGEDPNTLPESKSKSFFLNREWRIGFAWIKATGCRPAGSNGAALSNTTARIQLAAYTSQNCPVTCQRGIGHRCGNSDVLVWLPDGQTLVEGVLSGIALACLGNSSMPLERTATAN
jgi:hypothetical protein